ncbi:Fe2OG dioxygenase domain-containing protein [Chloropicon primus]|nr:Fe2OG dioxygenase domain-containing protein [Chloropicon primus]
MGRKKKRNTRHDDGAGSSLGSRRPCGIVEGLGGPGCAPPCWLEAREVQALSHVLREVGKVSPPEDPLWRSPALKPLRKALWPLVGGVVRVYRARGGVASKRERQRQKKRKLDSASQLALLHEADVALSRGNGERGSAGEADRAGGDSAGEADRAVSALVGSRVYQVALGVLGKMRERGGEGESVDYVLVKSLKGLRIALHPFVEAFIDEENSSWTARASNALLDGRMGDAYVALKAIKAAGKVPKLGAVQRWVRDCMNEDDFAALRSKESVKTLDAIIRLQAVRWWWQDEAGDAGRRAAGGGSGDALIQWHEPFAASERKMPVPTDPSEIAWQNCGDDGDGEAPSASAPSYTGRFGTRGREARCGELSPRFPPSSYSVVYEEKAAERVPPNRYDLRIYKLPRDAVRFEDSADGTQKRVEVPNLPGAFVLVDVLTSGECDQIIAAAESSPHGYIPDESATSAPAPKGFAPRATNFVWLSDEITDRIFKRVGPLLPQAMGKGGQHELRGINSRLRLYRYSPGAIYRPHVDGAWPGSGSRTCKDDEGNDREVYCYDFFKDRWSRLTFLVYLNEEFEGGCTTFYTPAPEEGRLEAYSVSPRTGSVLVFPHGGDSGSLVHEGSNVTRGAKYVIRTDVLYS